MPDLRRLASIEHEDLCAMNRGILTARIPAWFSYLPIPKIDKKRAKRISKLLCIGGGNSIFPRKRLSANVKKKNVERAFIQRLEAVKSVNSECRQNAGIRSRDQYPIRAQANRRFRRAVRMCDLASEIWLMERGYLATRGYRVFNLHSKDYWKRSKAKGCK